MLGFVKNIINRSGEKKNGGFYLQLDEDGNDVKATPTPQAVIAKANEVNGNGKTAAATKSVQADTPTENPAPEAKKSAKVSIKKAKAKTPKTEPVAVTPAPAVKPAKPPEPTEKTFAPKYLTPTSTSSRRRPGANMNGFLEMARQAKIPVNKK